MLKSFTQRRTSRKAICLKQMAQQEQREDHRWSPRWGPRWSPRTGRCKTTQTRRASLEWRGDPPATGQVPWCTRRIGRCGRSLSTSVCWHVSSPRTRSASLPQGLHAYYTICNPGLSCMSCGSEICPCCSRDPSSRQMVACHGKGFRCPVAELSLQEQGYTKHDCNM